MIFDKEKKKKGWGLVYDFITKQEADRHAKQKLKVMKTIKNEEIVNKIQQGCEDEHYKVGKMPFHLKLREARIRSNFTKFMV